MNMQYCENSNGKKKVTDTGEQRVLDISFLILSICLIKQKAGLLRAPGHGSYTEALRSET